MAPVEADKKAILSADSWGTELIRPGTPVVNFRGDENLRGGSMTRRTWKSAHQLERAVQDFARDNDGIYPGLFDYPNIAGKTLLDYLPSGQKLRNAFSGLRTEPSGYNAEYSGAIGYNVYVSDAVNVGYIISAQGADASEVLVLVFDPE